MIVCFVCFKVILLEPFYTFYNLMSLVKGAKIVYVPLRPKPEAHEKGFTTSADWVWDESQLEAAFTAKTKAIVICTPSNPLGKVLSSDELSKIASLCIKHNVICIADEVYHQMVYNEKMNHVSVATLPGMWERTITVGSSGKLLSCTGLKVSYTKKLDFTVSKLQRKLVYSFRLAGWLVTKTSSTFATK